MRKKIYKLVLCVDQNYQRRKRTRKKNIFLYMYIHGGKKNTRWGHSATQVDRDVSVTRGERTALRLTVPSPLW